MRFLDLYKTNGFDFVHHIHPTLRRRIRLFLILAAIMFVLAIWDIEQGFLSLEIAAISIVIGAGVGFISSRIFNLSWKHDGSVIVGRVDTLGFIVLALYIGFEVLRSIFFETVVHVGSSPTAITYVFVASALITRVISMRGRIIKILKDEKIFQPS